MAGSWIAAILYLQTDGDAVRVTWGTLRISHYLF
jgi:hypothetical protein